MESMSLMSRALNRGELFTGFAGSVALHVLIVLVVLVSQWVLPGKPFQAPYCTVNLVTLQDMGGELGAAKKGMPGQSADAAPAAEAPKPKAKASSQGKSSSLVPIRRLQMDEPERRPVSEIKKLDAPAVPKLAEESRASTVDKDLDKLITKPKPVQRTAAVTRSKDDDDDDGDNQQKAAAQNPSPAGGKQPGKTATSQGGSPEGLANGRSDGHPKGNAPSGGGGSPDGAQVASARMLYYKAIQDAIRRQYVLPPSLREQELQAVVVLVVRRDGKILDLHFEARSGNALFDESVQRAVRKADPLPPFPAVYSPSQEEMALRFRPEDLS